MTRTLARLEKSGWITKEIGTDKREKQIILTDASHQMYEKWLKTVRACEEQVLNNISDREKALILSIISKTNANLL